VYYARVDNLKRHKHSQHEGDKLVNTSTDSNKAVDDNINVDINNKTEDFEKASENVYNMKDVEKSSEPNGWITYKRLGLVG
jgi:hypothetical protein